MEPKREILRFCDPSTLAQTSRVSLAFLELSSSLLYDEIELIGDQTIRLFFCERDETHQPQLEPFLSLHRIRTLYISQDVFDDSEYYQEEERLEKERREAGIPSDSESDEEEDSNDDVEEGATRVLLVPRGLVFSRDRLRGSRPISLESLIVSIRGVRDDYVERASPFLHEMISLLAFFDPISVEIFGMPPFLHSNVHTSFPQIDIEEAPWTRLRHLLLHSCFIGVLPPIVEGPLTLVCDSSRWWDAQPSTAGVYDFTGVQQDTSRAAASGAFRCYVIAEGSRRDLELVVQDDGRDASEIEEDFWTSAGVPMNERDKWRDRVRFEVLEKGSPSLKMPHSGQNFPPFP